MKQSSKDSLSLHVCRGIDARLGGTSVSIPALARYTAQDGRFSNTLAVFRTADDQGNVDQTGMPKGAITEIPWQAFSPGTVVRSFRTLKELIALQDIVHIHGLWQPHTTMAARLAMGMGKPYLISAHGMLDAWALNHKKWKKAPYSMLVERKNLTNAACLRALTRTEIKDYRSFGVRAPIALIPNGVQPPASFSPASFYSRWPELRGKRIVLFLSRVHPKKGLELLCKAWRHIASSSEDLHLVLAGPDEDNTQAGLESLIAGMGMQNSVTFTGMLNHDMKWSAFSAATMFVLPSYSEGFSMAVLEALSASKPIVISRQCNFPELVDQEFARTIDTDVEQLRSAMTSFLALSSERLADLGQIGRSYVENRYSWARIGNAMADVYEWLLGGPIPSCVHTV